LTTDYDILKEVSNHVINTIPVKPLRYETLKWPLGFLTARCKQRGSGFTQREKDVSEKILGWLHKLDLIILRDLKKLDQKRTKQGNSFFPPLVVRAKSGWGKSILLGKVIAELIDAASGLGGKNWPSMQRIVFSQIKDNTSFESLEESICQGMDVYHRRENFEFMFSDTNSIPAGEKIIVIDSLDEHPNRADWWIVSEKLSNEGWKVIWSCRDPDWEIYSLSEKIPGEFKYDLPIVNKKKEKYPWEWKVPSWDLDYKNSPRNEEITGQINDLGFSGETSIEQYIDFCYSTTQLMHIFYTNFDIIESARSDVDKLLMSTLLSRRTEFIDSNKIYSEKIEVFEDTDWYQQFLEANLSKIIIDTALDFLQETDGWKAFDVHKIWLEICQDFYAQEFIRQRKFGELSETIVRNSSVNVEDRRELMEDLIQLGILRASNKFRHRDFAVIAYICGANGLKKLEDREKEDVLFQHFYQTEKIEAVEEFIRRTGNITALIEPLYSFPGYPTNLLAKRSKMIFDDQKGRFEKGLSRTQIRAMSSGQHVRPIILKGFPGTGKTYTGVERILIRQANNVRNNSSSKPLIISLNEQLANSIHGDLYRQHKESPFLDLFDSEQEKMDVLHTIDVRSMKQVIEEWIPEITQLENGNDWLIDSKALNEMFLEMVERTIFDIGDWRGLLRDFQENLFDPATGLIRPLNVVLGSKHTLPQADKTQSISKKKIDKKRKEWYERVKRELQRGKFSLIRACVFLRNLLLKYEHNNSGLPDELWNVDYDPDPSIEIDQQICFDHFETQFNSGKYDCVMIDEVQDMPAMAVLCLSFLSPFRNPNQFILSGDHLQTLNGNPFEWEPFLKSLDYHAKAIITEVNHINNTSNHHLRSLNKLKDSLEDILGQHLTDNHRNHEAITEFTKFAWEQWPSTDFTDDDTFPLREMKSVKKEKTDTDDNTDIPRILEIESADKDDFLSKIEDVLEFLNASAKISLLYANDFLQEYVREEIMNDESKSLRVESFTPWTIKGLERDAVVILGGYVAGTSDPDSRVLVSDPNKEEHKTATQLMRRKMLVSKTRAVEQLILLNAPRNKSIDVSRNGQHKLQSLNPPRVSDFIQSKSDDTDFYSIIVEAGDKIGMKLKEFFKDSVVDKELTSIVALSEGIDLSKRANNQADVKTEFEYYHGRKSSIFNNDVSDSVLREILHNVIALSKNEPLNNCLLVEDLLKQRNSRSYVYSDNSHPVIPHRNDKYSRLVSSTLQLLMSKGPWNKGGFNAVLDIFTLLNEFQNRKQQFSKLKDEITQKHRGAEEEIQKLFDSFEALYRDYTSYLGTPKSLLKPTQIPAFLLSTENNILHCEYHGQDIEEDVLQLFIASLHNASIDSRGNLFINVGQNQFDIDWSTMIVLLSSILDLSQDGKFENTPQNLRFVVNLAQLHYNFIEKSDLSSGLRKNLEKSNSTIIQLIVGMENKEMIHLCIEELAHFINKGFKGLEVDGLKKDILEKSITKSDTLHHEIENSTITAWNFNLFMTFINNLTGKTGTANTNRARELMIEARHLNKALESAYQDVRKNDQPLNISDLSSTLYVKFRNSGEDKLKEDYQEYFYRLTMTLVQSMQNGIRDLSANRICMDLFVCVQLISTHLKKDPFDFLKHKDEPRTDKEKEELRSGGKQAKPIKLVYAKLVEALDVNFINGQIDKITSEMERNLVSFKETEKENHGEKVNQVVESVILLQYLIELRTKKTGETPYEQFDGNVSEILMNFPSVCRLFSKSNSNICSVISEKPSTSTIAGAEEILRNLHAQNLLEKAFTGGSTSNYKTLTLNFDGFGGKISLNNYIEKNLKIIEPTRLERERLPWIKLIKSTEIKERFKVYKDLLHSIKHILYLNRTNDSTSLERLVKTLIFGPTKAHDVFKIRNYEGKNIEVSIFEGDENPIEVLVESKSVKLSDLWWSTDFVEGLRNLGIEISRVEGKKVVIDHDRANQRIDELIVIIDEFLNPNKDEDIDEIDYSHFFNEDEDEGIEVDLGDNEEEKFVFNFGGGNDTTTASEEQKTFNFGGGNDTTTTNEEQKTFNFGGGNDTTSEEEKTFDFGGQKPEQTEPDVEHTDMFNEKEKDLIKKGLRDIEEARKFGFTLKVWQDTPEEVKKRFRNLLKDE